MLFRLVMHSKIILIKKILPSQYLATCSKSTVKIIEKGVKYVQS